MAKRKSNSASVATLSGQLSLWDITISEKAVPQVEAIETVKIIAEDNIYSLTADQKGAIEKFKLNYTVSRVILYNGGSIGIEIENTGIFSTHYINKDGVEEFSFYKKSPVLPSNRIIYFSPDNEKLSFTKIQTDKLQRLLCNKRRDIKKVIHRKGDENILVELEGGIIDILPNGWELEFKNAFIPYTEDEIYLAPVQEEKEDLEDIQNRVKTGNLVKALNGKTEIDGLIIREYGPNNETLNIIFDNGKKHTAINRRAVIAILG